MNATSGDKVRIKNGTHTGERAVVDKVRTSGLIVRLDTTGELVHTSESDVTNYSLAARKAWQSMPDRRVGRPKGTAKTDRVSVTLRIDRELWKRFKEAEGAGLIDDRTATINEWIAERLAGLIE